ncbi:MAG: hypothetical protein CVV27_13430, partial [Candidatus Melainabacteria bacterium HGW-Melainabacteria-1]
MKLKALSAALAGMALLSACTTISPNVSSPSDYGAAPRPEASGGLASLLTGQVVSADEQQLRDIQKRQILLDFPVKVGVVFYNLNTRLEATDIETRFDAVSTAFKDSGLVRETLRMPSTLISSSVTIEELRRLGARFQTDIVVLVTGTHQFQKAKSQNLSFFDSFSDKAYFDSEVKFEAIALDVFTGILLSPFDAAAKASSVLLDQGAADYSNQAYQYQLRTETQAWEALQTEAI